MQLDALSKERCVTCGARDRTLRVWKIIEASQLVFKAEDIEGSLDCVALLDEDHFVSGSEKGTISIWHVGHKRPLVSYSDAHRHEDGTSGSITALATVPMTDLFVSGSNNGQLTLWKVSDRFKKMEKISSISASGFITSISMIFHAETEQKRQLGQGTVALVACLAQEPRLGRWCVDKGVENSILVANWAQ